MEGSQNLAGWQGSLLKPFGNQMKSSVVITFVVNHLFISHPIVFLLAESETLGFVPFVPGQNPVAVLLFRSSCTSRILIDGLAK